MMNFVPKELPDLAKYVSNFTLPDQFLQLVSNFHFLLFLYTNHFVEFKVNEIRNLADIVRQSDAEAAKNWAEQSPNWGTLTILMHETGRHRTAGNYF
jgi:hypothetical protein